MKNEAKEETRKAKYEKPILVRRGKLTQVIGGFITSNGAE